MSSGRRLTRRAMIHSASGFAAAGLAAYPLPGFARQATPGATPIANVPLWRPAWANGIVYGTSTTTWQLDDEAYAALVAEQAAILFTEDLTSSMACRNAGAKRRM